MCTVRTVGPTCLLVPWLVGWLVGWHETRLMEASVAYLESEVGGEGTFQVYIFKSVQILT